MCRPLILGKVGLYKGTKRHGGTEEGGDGIAAQPDEASDLIFVDGGPAGADDTGNARGG